MTLRRIDPWSVLKFGFVINLCLLAIGALGFGVLWFVIRQLGIIGQICDVAIDIGFTECGVNGGNLFRLLLLFGVLGVIVQTGLLVFFSFLHNLIADLVGGISVSVYEEGVTGERRPPAFSSRGPADTSDRDAGRAAAARGSGGDGPSRAGDGGESQTADSDDSGSWRRTAPRRADRSDERLFGGS